MISQAHTDTDRYGDAIFMETCIDFEKAKFFTQYFTDTEDGRDNDPREYFYEIKYCPFCKRKLRKDD